jgi:SHS2 domain-containing protein
MPRNFKPPKRHWQHFEHGADVGIRGHGATLEAAFEEAARALAAIVVDPDTVSPAVAVPMACTAPNDEILLIDWLNAVVYEMAARNMAFSTFEVHINDCRLTGTAHGERVDPSRHETGVEVKGATFTALKVARDGDGWIAQCVVDV